MMIRMYRYATIYVKKIAFCAEDKFHSPPHSVMKRISLHIKNSVENSIQTILSYT